jgi:hypothetical protein
MTRLDDDTPREADAWSWEARRVRDLATGLGLTLDKEEGQQVRQHSGVRGGEE